ncbi:lysine--tRNA ligase [Mycoplasma sp. Mirounga ES2805-ORL]|uniref:lysine--tRNA ligase n=1 Tax=Mycoplasma sp. Mirounga ES2805-ORL TaxID=754514 RepID=UPI00197B23DB|nr:lysine--tRNA ligase [Mycoplasma sp. Mirounga ES2805-ORL]QSF13530.1 lysine--tRNA ligase [Mycoplasma sp. Mirounga ES2805-ORL]
MEKYTEQEQVRRDKVESYLNEGTIPFKKAYNLGKISYSAEIEKLFANRTKDELHEANKEVNVAGRIMTKRGPFIVIQDYKGQIQLYFNKKELPDLAKLVESLDLGDIIWTHGFVMKTNTGEISVKVNKLELLTKSLKPLPDKFHGLVDKEDRYRRRYVDLIMNKESRERFLTRTKIVQWIRDYFNRNDYIEAETPLLHDYISGAAAKPFSTHHNSLNQEFVLRIATEIPLKKLVVGGFDRVYEMGRIFRNEGYDTTHNPEFTTIEFYEAYSNIEGMMNHTETLIKELAKKLGKSKFINNGVEVDLSQPFKRLNMVDAVSSTTGVDFRTVSLEKAKEVAKKYNIKIEKFFTIGHIINALYEELIEETLIQPTFVYGHPIEVSPLASKADDNRFTERAELFINTKEYANMYTELSDPIDQLARFEDQVKEKESGNDEASEIDYDFVEALEYGMPPTGGCGIGIDRLVMLLTETDSIRDVLLFPTLKKIKK